MLKTRCHGVQHVGEMSTIAKGSNSPHLLAQAWCYTSVDAMKFTPAQPQLNPPTYFRVHNYLRVISFWQNQLSDSVFTPYHKGVCRYNVTLSRTGPVGVNRPSSLPGSLFRFPFCESVSVAAISVHLFSQPTVYLAHHGQNPDTRVMCAGLNRYWWYCVVFHYSRMKNAATDNMAKHRGDYGLVLEHGTSRDNRLASYINNIPQSS